MTQQILSFDEVVDTLCRPESYKTVFHPTGTNHFMPSVAVLEEIVSRLKAVLFPGYFGKSDISAATMRYQIGSSLDTVQHLLADQIARGGCFSGDSQLDCSNRAKEVVSKFLSCLPEIRALLATDVEAAPLKEIQLPKHRERPFFATQVLLLFAITVLPMPCINWKWT